MTSRFWNHHYSMVGEGLRGMLKYNKELSQFTTEEYSKRHETGTMGTLANIRDYDGKIQTAYNELNVRVADLAKSLSNKDYMKEIDGVVDFESKNEFNRMFPNTTVKYQAPILTYINHVYILDSYVGLINYSSGFGNYILIPHALNTKKCAVYKEMSDKIYSEVGSYDKNCRHPLVLAFIYKSYLANQWRWYNYNSAITMIKNIDNEFKNNYTGGFEKTETNIKILHEVVLGIVKQNREYINSNVIPNQVNAAKTDTDDAYDKIFTYRSEPHVMINKENPTLKWYKNNAEKNNFLDYYLNHKDEFIAPVVKNMYKLLTGFNYTDSAPTFGKSLKPKKRKRGKKNKEEEEKEENIAPMNTAFSNIKLSADAQEWKP